MPVMFAPGRQRAFRTLEEGLKAGFYPTFNDLAKAKRRELVGEPAPAPTPAPKSQTDGYSNEDIKALAISAGIETEGVHHKTLRKKVEEYLSGAQERTDQSQLFRTED